MYPCSTRIRAISRLRRLDGISTVSWAAMIALRMRVRKSATGSVIDMRSPARLRHAGDEALVGELAQADPAQAELAVDRARATAPAAARVLPGLVLLRPGLPDDLALLCHISALSVAPKPPRARPPGSRSRGGARHGRTASPARRAARRPRRRLKRWS